WLAAKQKDPTGVGFVSHAVAGSLERTGGGCGAICPASIAWAPLPDVAQSDPVRGIGAISRDPVPTEHDHLAPLLVKDGRVIRATRRPGCGNGRWRPVGPSSARTLPVPEIVEDTGAGWTARIETDPTK